MKSRAIVYIDRLYDDDWDIPQPWRRRRRWVDDEPTWTAGCDYVGHTEEGGFESVEEAIAWGVERAEVVLVRLGTSIDAMYSAGSRHATERVDGTGWPFPPWPPASWPNYTGPPEPGWPEYPDGSVDA